MKQKTIFILATVLSLALTNVSNAQVKDIPMSTTVGDTLDATSAADTSLHATNKVGYYERISITTLVTKVSGSVTGTALLQVSNYGTEGSWSDYGTDTLIITNKSYNTKTWSVPHSYKFYRVWTRIATGVAVVNSIGYGVKPDK